VECLTVRLRKFGITGLFAPGTPKHFNPMVGSCHPGNMHLRRTDQANFAALFELTGRRIETNPDERHRIGHANRQNLQQYLRRANPCS
jgi:hypothetical protein